MTSTIIVSCGSTRNTATIVKKSPVGKSGGDAVSKNQAINIPPGLAPQSQALLKEARAWLGTPYKYGGTDKGGVDCSGLVMSVYNSALAIKMPRNSKAQSDYCTPTPKDNLVPGDLLFFATGGGKNVSHVGIFIGDNRMIHSSTSKGVIVSDINADYYIRTFAGSGRVEQYHAMLTKNKGKNKTETTPVRLTDEKTSITLDEFISSSGNYNRMENDSRTSISGSGNTPLSSASANTAAESKPMVISTVNPADSANVAKEISTEDARATVLNSIIEQKLDSIYSK